MIGTRVFHTLLIFTIAMPQGSDSQQARISAERGCGEGVLHAEIDGSMHRGIIEDPAIGLRWKLENDPRYPAGPGKLVAISGQASCRRGSTLASRASEGSGLFTATRAVVIRKGDSMLVLQESNVVHAELSAIALSDGASGDSINVRLRFAGRVVQARITGPGQARLMTNKNEVRR